MKEPPLAYERRRAFVGYYLCMHLCPLCKEILMSCRLDEIYTNKWGMIHDDIYDDNNT